MRRLVLALVVLVVLVALGGCLRPRGDGHARARRAEGRLGFASLDEHSLYLVMVDRFFDSDERPFAGRDATRALSFHGGDLEGVRRKLPYLADLGVTALWLTPLHLQVAAPAGDDDEAHWPLHGYWPEELGRIDPRFGDGGDLARLLDDAHALDLRVVLDVVTNHLGYGASRATDAAWVRPCDEGGDERTQCLFGLPDLRTEDPRVRAHVVDETAAWAARFPLDGFRFDAAKHVEPELLAEVNARAGEGFLTIAEHWGAASGSDVVREVVASGAADTLFDFSLAGLVESFLAGRMRAEALAHHLEEHHRAQGPPLVGYLATHDTAPLLHRLGDDVERYALAPFLLFTVRGIPLVTWGEELGKAGGPWPDNRRPMPWSRLDDDEGRRLRSLWRALLWTRRRAPELYGAAFRTLLATSDDEAATLAFLRGRSSVVVVHRGAARERVLEGLPQASVVEPCVASDVRLGGALVTDERGRLTLALPKDSAVLLSIAPLACPTLPPPLPLSSPLAEGAQR